MNVREYESADERGWVQCRVLAFLDTAYYDDVHREKERYRNPAIELVAEEDDRIVGLVDVELDTADRAVCSDREGEGGMIWHLAVHPEYRRRGIASTLLDTAVRKANESGVSRLEAWTRDDDGTLAWYDDRGFSRIDSYLHVYLNREEASRDLQSSVEGVSVNQAFAQYAGDRTARISDRYDRVHECQLFERPL